jgi:hypothetical protein
LSLHLHVYEWGKRVWGREEGTGGGKAAGIIKRGGLGNVRERGGRDVMWEIYPRFVSDSPRGRLEEATGTNTRTDGGLPTFTLCPPLFLPAACHPSFPPCSTKLAMPPAFCQKSWGAIVTYSPPSSCISLAIFTSLFSLVFSLVFLERHSSTRKLREEVAEDRYLCDRERASSCVVK